MIVKLLTEHHLEFLSLKGDCTGSSESTHVKMPHCWKSHVAAHLFYFRSAMPRCQIYQIFENITIGKRLMCHSCFPTLILILR